MVELYAFPVTKKPTLGANEQNTTEEAHGCQVKKPPEEQKFYCQDGDFVRWIGSSDAVDGGQLMMLFVKRSVKECDLFLVIRFWSTGDIDRCYLDGILSPKLWEKMPPVDDF